MEKTVIVDYLKQNDLVDIEEIKYKDDVFLARFYYDFDDAEIEAATAYANDECTEEAEGEKWNQEFFMPYLNDLVIDNVGEIIEECMEKFSVESQYITYDIDEEQVDCVEIIVEFASRGQEIDIEKVIEDLKL